MGTNTQAFRFILQDPFATPRERRYALAMLQAANAAKHRDFDRVVEARKQIAGAA